MVMKISSISVVAMALVCLSCERIMETKGPADKDKKDGEKPNIVFILTDDQRYDAYSAAGHPFLDTPNLDRLANEGATFSNTFVTTSLCSPSRSSILTGMYAHHSGVPTNEHLTDPDPGWPTFPKMLLDEGYETAFIGKWHMARHKRPREGFSHWVSFYNQGNYYGNELNVDGELVWTDDYITDVLTEYSLKFLKRKRDRPFMLYLSHKAVHSPFTPSSRHKSLYEEVEVNSNHDPNDNLTTKQKWRKHKERNSEGAIRQEAFRNYARAIKAVDESLGKILEQLETQGLLENTLVAFSSDNGFFQGEHGGMTDKRHAYEPSMRVPLLMRYPELIPKKSNFDQMILNIDLMPTFLDLGGLPIPETVQGKSIMPLIKEKAEGRKSFLYEYFFEEYDYSERPTVLAVRTESYKYITYPGLANATEELYDLKNDPEELRNLFNEHKYALVKEDLKNELERLKIETGFQMDPPTPRENIEMIQMWQKLKGYNIREGALKMDNNESR